MTKRIFQSVLSISVLTGMFPAAYAAESENILVDSSIKNKKDSEVTQLEKIVVTASGFEQNIKKAAASISVLTQEEINKKASVHDKFHRTLILSGFCFLKIAKISL
ncbi:hypothetical protein ACVH7R_06660, partial [Acinetobacter baumannii]